MSTSFRRWLGRSGIQISAMGMGCWAIGGPFWRGETPVGWGEVDDDESIRAVHRALDLGITFFDTANVYGAGHSERVLARALEGRRDQVVIATKFGFVDGRPANGTDSRPERIRQVAEESLRRLRTDRIDLYQVHMQDITVPEEETLRALDDLVRQGKVLYIGCSNYAAYRMVQSLGISERRGYASYVALQAQYSLIERNLEREHVPACRELGLGLLPWSPLAGGFLTGKYRRGSQPPEGARLERTRFNFSYYDREQNWRVLEALEQVAGECGSTPAQVALAWLLRQPQVSSVIFGCRSIEQLEQNLAAESLALSDPQVARLEEVSRPDWGYPYSFIRGVQERW